MTHNQNPYGGYPSKHIAAREEKANQTPTGTIPELLEWVGTDKERAQRVSDAESAHAKPRKSLLKDLKDILDAD